MKTITVTKQDFMKVTDIKEHSIFNIFEESYDVEYNIAITIPYSNISENIKRNKGAIMLLQCFDIHYSKYNVQHTDINIDKKLNKIKVTHIMTIGDYLKNFKKLDLYITRLSGDIYIQQHIEISAQKHLREFLEDLASLDTNVIYTTIKSIDINKKINYCMTEMNNKYCLMQVTPSDNIKEFNGHKVRIIDGKCKSDKSMKKIYDLVESCDLLKKYKTKLYSFGYNLNFDDYMNEIVIENGLYVRFDVRLAYQEVDIFGEKCAIIKVIYLNDSDNKAIDTITSTKSDKIPSYIHYVDSEQKEER